jgi:hypothetical protein
VLNRIKGIHAMHTMCRTTFPLNVCDSLLLNDQPFLQFTVPLSMSNPFIQPLEDLCVPFLRISRF